jgi:hypothetical protein
MKLKKLLALAICAAGLFAPQTIRPQGILVLSNTNQPIGGYTGVQYDGARSSFVPGSNLGGYELTGVAIQFGDNPNAGYTNIEIMLFEAGDPENLDHLMGVITPPPPESAGLYFYSWPTNIFLPGEAADVTPIYYAIYVTAGTDNTKSNYETTVNIAYTTSTNYTTSVGWIFSPAYNTINDHYGAGPLINLFATVLPPPLLPVLYPINLTNAVILPDGSFQFGFTNTPGLSFTAYATTNLTLSFTNWFYAGNPENVSSNYYEYNTGPGVVTDPAYPGLFMRVTSP